VYVGNGVCVGGMVPVGARVGSSGRGVAEFVRPISATTVSADSVRMASKALLISSWDGVGDGSGLVQAARIAINMMLMNSFKGFNSFS
jgi:hypothetical protein